MEFPSVYGPRGPDFLETFNDLFSYEVYNIPRSTVLHAAVSVHRIDYIKRLLELNVDTSKQDENGFSPLMLSLSLGY